MLNAGDGRAPGDGDPPKEPVVIKTNKLDPGMPASPYPAHLRRHFTCHHSLTCLCRLRRTLSAATLTCATTLTCANKL